MKNSAIGAYLDPALARANLALSQQLNAARRAAKALEQRQREQIAADKAQLMRLGWNEEAANDMAKAKARMEAEQ